MDDHDYEDLPPRPRPLWIRVTAVIALVALAGFVVLQIF